MIEGSFRQGNSPHLLAFVELPRIGSAADVEFLIDTGSAISVLHPFDARAMGVVFDEHFSNEPAEVNLGVGGGGRFFREPAVLALTHADGALARYRIRIRVAVPSPANVTLPSVLGMDFIEHFRLTVSARERRVELDALF